METLNKPLHILLVEDSEDDCLLLLRELRRHGYEPHFERVDTRESMRAALERQHWDVVISDYLMPDFSGLAAFELLQQSGLDLPFIIVSGNIGEDTAVTAMKAGAHDYISKRNLTRLVPAVERELREAAIRREVKHAETAFNEQSRLLDAFFQHALTPLVFLDKKFNYIRVNEAYAAACGRSVADFLGYNHFELYPSDELQRKFEKVIATKVPYSVSARPFVFPDHPEWGTSYWDLNVAPILDSSGDIDVLVFTLQDVTERRNAEEKISRLNRLYSVLSRVNEAIVRVHEPDELYRQVCRIAVEDGGFKMAWVGLVDPKTRRVIPRASHGDSGGYLSNIVIYATDVPEGQGPVGRAASEGSHFICSDIEHNPIMLPWRDKALRNGLRSSAAFPLFAGAAIIGTFTIYADKPQFFTKEEVNLLLSLAADISFAVESIANEQKRLKAEEALQKSAADLIDLYNNSPCGYHSLDKSGVFIRINDTELKWLGYARNEIVGKKSYVDLLSPESIKIVDQQYPLFMQRGYVNGLELDFIRKDRTVLPVLLNATALYDSHGNFVMSRSTVYDVTERTETESKSKITNSLLALYTQTFNQKEYLDAAVQLLRDWAGWRHIGVRIADRGGNIPFIACWGYDADFLSTEGTLSLQDDNCICTRIAIGALEAQDLPAVTPYGSFYSNNISQFIGSSTNTGKTHYRGYCMKNGYTSLAVIPIRYRDSVIGAIHVADEREGMVPLRTVEFLEYLAHIVGEAIYRFSIEDDLHRNFAALRVSETRYRNLFDDVRDIIFTLAPDGTVTALNPAFEALSGLPRDEVIGKHFANMIHPDDLQHAERFLHTILSGNALPPFELRGRTRSGNDRFLEFKITMGHRGQGEILGIARDVTERKNAEEILKLANAYNRSLIESSLDPLVTIGPDGSITDVNEATEAATGLTRKELIGTEFTEYFTDPAKARSGYQQVFREGAVRDYALEIRHRDGHTTPVLYNASLYRDDAGKVIGVFAAARDITDLRESELKNTVTNNLLKLFTQTYSPKAYLEAAVNVIRSWCGCRSVGMRVTDRDGNIPYQAYTGYDADFIKSENSVSLVRDQCTCTRVVSGALEPLDSAASTPNGSLFYNNAVEFMKNLTAKQKKLFRSVCQRCGYKSVAVIPIRYRDRILGAIHLADEKEGLFSHKSIEFLEGLAYIIGEAMFRFGVEEDQRRLVSAVESSADAVVITDTEGIIRYVNHAFELITGYRKEEVLHASLHVLDSGQHNEDFFKTIREEIDRNNVWRGLLINRKKDGSLYYEDCTFSTVKSAAGDTIIFVSIKRDVTEKLRLESIAESVNTMDNIGYVFSGVRHEIGNPINSAKMSLNVLQYKLDTASKDVIKDYVERALSEIGRVEHLLKSLKNYNLYETPELENLNMADFMTKFFQLISEDFTKHGIKLTHEVQPGAEWVVADPRALQQVLLNIMTNAFDALAGRLSPSIKVIVTKKYGRILLEIADNGSGMTEKQQQDLFKPFYTSKARGTGLGLVLVKKMLTRMSGEITITSQPAEGTTVNIMLPEGTDGAAR